MDRQTDREMERQTDRWLGRLTDQWKEAETDGRIDRRTFKKFCAVISSSFDNSIDWMKLTSFQYS